MLPDYVLVCVSPSVGVTDICIQQMTVAVALDLPLIFVLTKTDVSTDMATDILLRDINELYRSINVAIGSTIPSEMTVRSCCFHLCTFCSLLHMSLERNLHTRDPERRRCHFCRRATVNLNDIRHQGCMWIGVSEDIDCIRYW